MRYWGSSTLAPAFTRAIGCVSKAAACSNQEQSRFVAGDGAQTMGTGLAGVDVRVLLVIPAWQPLAAPSSSVVNGDDVQAMGAELADVDVRVEASVRPPESAAGDGCGVLLVAATSTGCLLGSSGVGARPQEHLGLMFRFTSRRAAAACSSPPPSPAACWAPAAWVRARRSV